MASSLPDSFPVVSYDIPARISLALLLSTMRDDWGRIRSNAGRARKRCDYPILLLVHCRGVPRGGSQGFQKVPKQNQLLSAVIEKEAPNAEETTLLSLPYKMGRTAGSMRRDIF